MSDNSDITPPDSIAPVYRSDAVSPGIELPPLDQVIQERQDLLDAGVAKLVALGLTEDEARAMVQH